MTEPTEISPEARMAVVAAFAYAGPLGGNEAAWRKKLNQGAIVAAAAMNGKAARLAQEILDSDVFRGEYRGYRLEETSQRLIVDVFTDNHSPRNKRTDGVEEIRTDRTDTKMGEAMRERLDRLPLGSTILVFKYMEKMSGSTDEVRIMKHFEVLNINKDSASVSAASSAPAPKVESTASPEPAGDQSAQVAPAGETEAQAALPLGSASDPFEEVSFVSRIGALRGPDAAKLARAARKEGIDNIMSEKHRARMEELLEELERA